MKNATNFLCSFFTNNKTNSLVYFEAKTAFKGIDKI